MSTAEIAYDICFIGRREKYGFIIHTAFSAISIDMSTRKIYRLAYDVFTKCYKEPTTGIEIFDF